MAITDHENYLPITHVSIPSTFLLAISPLHLISAAPILLTVKSMIPQEIPRKGREMIVECREPWAGRVFLYSPLETRPRIAFKLATPQINCANIC